MRPAAALLLLLLACGCSGGGAPDPVSSAAAARAEGAPAVALAPGWSDADGRAAARQLAAGCLRGAWLQRVQRRLGRAPTLALDPVANRSSEHVNTLQLARQLRAALAARAGARVKLAAQGQPGDLRLRGRLASQDDRTEATSLQALLLSLSLQDAATAEVLWADSYLVRKLTTRTPPAKPGAPPGPPRVRTLAPDQVVDVSGAFNGHDAGALARAAIEDLLKSRWLAGDRAPVVRIQPLKNRSAEQISGDFFTAPLTRALVRHPRARVVAPGAQSGGQALAATHELALELQSSSRASRGVVLTRYDLVAAAASLAGRVDWVFRRAIQKVINQAPAGATVR